MLDIQYVRENLEAVRANCVNRLVKADPAVAVEADDHRRALAQRTQTVQERQNEVSKLIAKEKDQTGRQALISEGKALREEAQGLEAKLRDAEVKVREALCQLPNLTHPEAPIGGDPDSILPPRIMSP